MLQFGLVMETKTTFAKVCQPRYQVLPCLSRNGRLGTERDRRIFPISSTSDATSSFEPRTTATTPCAIAASKSPHNASLSYVVTWLRNRGEKLIVFFINLVLN